MFKRLHDVERNEVVFHFDGQPIRAYEGESVAVALLTANVTSFRATPRLNRPRSVFCMMGACFDCLVTVDGQSDRQACLVEARDGMNVRRQEGAGEAP